MRIAGHRLTVTNLDKVMYPETGTTKADVLRYYADIAEQLIPYAADRPVTRKRWVDGVGGQVFFQKDIEDSAPDWVPTRVIHHRDHDNWYPVLDERTGPATLGWFGQVAALELHVPQWRFAPDGTPGEPDRMVFDLDPGEGVGLPECVEVAKLIRGILDDMGLASVPVTSGSKGIHLYAVLGGGQSSEQVNELAHELARSLEADHPELIISTMRKIDRRGKVLVDWSQNNASKTTIAPYSLRGRSRPTVAMPRTWREITSGRLRQIEFDEVLPILRRRGDAAEPMRPADQSPGASSSGRSPSASASPRSLSERSESKGDPDRLHRYRSMRDAAKTPEPVPAARARIAAGRDDTFVIQRHEASRLHFDFRLERDGVLVSWAVPKGVPALGERNHLAVHVEDHPVEYATFSGDIPKGEYGAGHVDVWDHGTYETEKWREDEVIVTLHGEPDGGLGGEPAKVALIRTDRDEGKDWLMHRMALPGAETRPRHEPAGGAEGRPAAKRPRARKAASRAEKTEAPAGHTTAEFRELIGGDPAPRTPPSERADYQPMLAQLGSRTSVPRGVDLAVEMKWDGVRTLARVRGGETRLFSRNGLDVTPTYPEFADLAGVVAGRDAVLDGEIIALDARGYPSFGLLQQRMRLTREADVRRAMAAVPVRFVLFDLLALDGSDVTGLPWRERRALLEDAVRERSDVQLSPVLDLSVDEALRRAEEVRLEGVLVKDREAPYAVGRRSYAWIKVKLHKTQEVVIAGWRPGKGSRGGGIGSLILGVPEGDRLQYVGRVGTGFDEATLAELGRLTRRLARRSNPLTGVPASVARDAHWVSPELVGEVEYAERTRDGRLRQPSWRGLRPDKAPTDVRPEVVSPR